MRAMRDRRRRAAYREVRLSVPDARSEAVRRRVAEQISLLKPQAEAEAMAWIEAVSEFDSDGAR
ncbi:MAG TPA: antitoxin MazE-like protein [Caulobacteraceae bacterium]|nr:antitoxin MazE-like protein [Caulobacteraceae bacterium]